MGIEVKIFVFTSRNHGKQVYDLSVSAHRDSTGYNVPIKAPGHREATVKFQDPNETQRVHNFDANTISIQKSHSFLYK